MVTSAEMNTSCRTNDVVCIFSYEYLYLKRKSYKSAVKRIGKCARADLPIRLVLKANRIQCENTPYHMVRSIYY